MQVRENLHQEGTFKVQIKTSKGETSSIGVIRLSENDRHMLGGSRYLDEDRLDSKFLEIILKEFLFLEGTFLFDKCQFETYSYKDLYLIDKNISIGCTKSTSDVAPPLIPGVDFQNDIAYFSLK